MIVDKEYVSDDFGFALRGLLGNKIRYFYIAAIVCRNIFNYNSVKPPSDQIIISLKNKK